MENCVDRTHAAASVTLVATLPAIFLGACPKGSGPPGNTNEGFGIVAPQPQMPRDATKRVEIRGRTFEIKLHEVVGLTPGAPSGWSMQLDLDGTVASLGGCEAVCATIPGRAEHERSASDAPGYFEGCEL